MHPCMFIFIIIPAPYAPPSGVHVEKVEMDQLIFTWNEVVPLSQCPYIRYVITATNCGVCPNTTTNTTITCSSFSVSVHENTLCMLTVQTDVCGSLLGEKSDHAIVNITGELLCMLIFVLHII